MARPAGRPLCPGRRPVRDALAGRVIVDITNPFDPTVTGLVTPDGSSAAEEIAQAAPAGAHVVKAFNTLFNNVLAAGPVEGRPLDVFIAGDDAGAKACVSASSRASPCARWTRAT
jgi:hypothetical protein